MTTREQFEQSWLSRDVDNQTSISSPPNLACWNAEGEPISNEAVREEWERCKSRIADLRQRLKDEEFLEAFCERCLGDLNSTNSVVMRNTTATHGSITKQLNSGLASIHPIRQASGNSSEEHEMEKHRPTIESLYISPADSRKTHIHESPYSEPFLYTDHDSINEADIYAEPFVPHRTNELNAKPSDSKKSAESTRKTNNIYDEIFDVRSDLTVMPATASDQDDESSEDDSVANMMAIRQSISRVSQFCIDGGSTRQQLQLQATRLSTRFSCMYDTKSSATNGHMNTVLESSILLTGKGEPVDTQAVCFDPNWTIPTPQIESSFIRNGSLAQPDLLRSSSTPLDMRKYIVTTLMESERLYIQTLDVLLQWWKTTGMDLSLSELNIMFELIKILHDAHSRFYANLDPLVSDWHPNNAIGEEMKALASNEYTIAPEYLKNFQHAVNAIDKYQQYNVSLESSFKAMHTEENSSLADFLRKPIIRFERNTLILHDLIKYTPTGHADYDMLQKTLRLARHFLDNLESPESYHKSLENQRYLVKHGLIVEKLSKERKLRHIFLFNDVIVAAKQKVCYRQKDQYDVRWFIPLVDLIIEDKVLSQDDMRATEEHKQQLESLQRKVSELQSEYKAEVKKTKSFGEGMKARILRRDKSLDKIRKKLMEQEVALVIAMPHMSFRVNNRRQQQQYNLMMSSDYERSDWSETISSLLVKAFQATQAPTQSTLALADVQNLLGKKKVVDLKRMGTSFDRDSVLMEEERLYGCLDVLVTKLHGLKQPVCAFCRIEVDSFGHFLTKAKTTIVGPSHEPLWNENFEVDLDGAQTLRVLCYKQDKGVEVLLGRGAIELSSMWLKDDIYEQAIAMNNELTLHVSLKHLSHEQSAYSCERDSGAVLFGARLDVTARREGCSIPQFLTKSLEAIEARGLNEEGLYRISGLSTEVNELKDAFERNLSSVYPQMLKTIDIHVVTNLVKLYFRSLPDPLFTEKLFSRFSEGIGLADPDSKDRHLMSLLCSLPSPNFTTALFLMDHLIKVSQHESRNKMSLQNLATIFGPTVIRPPKKSFHQKTTDQLFFLAANEVMVQTTVLYQLLLMRSSGMKFERSSHTN